MCTILDYWQCEVVLTKKRAEDDLDRPYCVDGAGACPPEDVGGTTGYEEMLRVFSSTDEPEKESYREWLGMDEGENWDPYQFSCREANKRLALLDSWSRG